MPVLKSARVVGYQAIKDTYLEFGSFTVLVGDGDAGKSSFLRALRAALLNDASDLDIREGEDLTEVFLNFGDPYESGKDIILHWRKDRGKGGCYEFLGRKYSKTAGQVPEEIAAFLRIGVLQIDANTDVCAQLSDQFDSVFLLGETGPRRAKVLGKATKLDLVITAAQACKREHDSLSRTHANLARQEVELVSAIEDIPDFSRISSLMDVQVKALEMLTKAEYIGNRLREATHTLATERGNLKDLDTTALQVLLSATSQMAEEASAQEAAVKALAWSRNMSLGAERELREALTTFTELDVAYEEVCETVGVCKYCGGVFLHEECK